VPCSASQPAAPLSLLDPCPPTAAPPHEPTSLAYEPALLPDMPDLLHRPAARLAPLIRSTRLPWPSPASSHGSAGAMYGGCSRQRCRRRPAHATETRGSEACASEPTRAIPHARAHTRARAWRGEAKGEGGGGDPVAALVVVHGVHPHHVPHPQPLPPRPRPPSAFPPPH
jgi:hypothetical protein